MTYKEFKQFSRELNDAHNQMHAAIINAMNGKTIEAHCEHFFCRIEEMIGCLLAAKTILTATTPVMKSR